MFCRDRHYAAQLSRGLMLTEEGFTPSLAILSSQWELNPDKRQPGKLTAVQPARGFVEILSRTLLLLASNF